MRVLLDTNIVIAHVQNGVALPDWGTHFALSVISEAEILRYPGATEHDIQKIEDWLSTVAIIPVDSAIARRAASLGRTRKTKLPDLLIAATAIEMDLPLMTKNKKDFTRIPGLTIRDNV